LSESLRRHWKLFGIPFTTFLSLITIIQASTYFGYPLLQGSGALGVVSIALLSTIAGLVFFIVENFERRGERVGSANILSKAVTMQIEKCIERHEYESAIVLAKSMSRPLWLEGRYRDRLRLGELLQRAASSVNPPDVPALVQALIDELGWTNIELNHFELASRNIHEGIKYAEQIDDPYLIARGYRHLSGLAQREGDKGNAQHYLDLAEKVATRITNKHREEMMAGISFGRGDLCLITNERRTSEKARGYFLAARAIQEKLGDRERLVKTNMRLGQTYQRLGENARAYDFFYRSLKSARDLSWLQQICEVDLHLGQLMLEEHNYADALKTFQEAKTISKYTDLETLYDEAVRLVDKTQKLSKGEKQNG